MARALTPVASLPPAGKRVRTPNVERSARTREKLLSATIQCLYEYGYHETSTVMVTVRAGVSRGSMLHHFPSKADLMMAAAEFIVQSRSAAHKPMAAMTDDRERFLALVDILWSEFQGPTGVARIEIMLASRSDPDLGPRFKALNEDLEDRHKVAIWPLAQRLGITDQTRVNAFVQFYAAALRGLAIDALSPRSRGDIEGAVALIKEFQIYMMDKALAEAGT